MTEDRTDIANTQFTTEELLRLYAVYIMNIYIYIYHDDNSDNPPDRISKYFVPVVSGTCLNKDVFE